MRMFFSARRPLLALELVDPGREMKLRGEAGPRTGVGNPLSATPGGGLIGYMPWDCSALFGLRGNISPGRDILRGFGGGLAGYMSLGRKTLGPVGLTGFIVCPGLSGYISFGCELLPGVGGGGQLVGLWGIFVGYSISGGYMARIGLIGL